MNHQQLLNTNSLPIATAAMRKVSTISSELSNSELSQISHVIFSMNNTLLNLPLNGYIQMLCYLGAECISKNMLFIYTPEATIIYHGYQFMIVNATARLQHAIEVSGMTASLQGRKLLSSCGWCAACIAVGPVIIMGGAALSEVTFGISLVAGVIAGGAISLTGLVGSLINK